MKPYHKQMLLEARQETTPASAVEGKLPSVLQNRDSLELLREVFATLRALSWTFQTLHWQVKGSDFYELHLLFERLYGSMGDEIDTLAEKMVGYYGNDAVDVGDSIDRSCKWVKEWKGDDPVDVAIKAEKHLQALLRHTYDHMNDKQELSLGLDDFLMGLASDHETHLYLLGQIKR
jgi:starvation-inducible DNA-binding protein